jgi:hypothetical protein
MPWRCILVSALDGGKKPASHPSGFIPREWYPLHKLGEPQSQFGHGAEEKKLFPLPGIEFWFFGCPTCCLVTTPTQLSQLLYNNKLSPSNVLWNITSTMLYENQGFETHCFIPLCVAFCSAPTSLPQMCKSLMSSSGCGKSLSWNFHSLQLAHTERHHRVMNSSPSSGHGLQQTHKVL